MCVFGPSGLSGGDIQRTRPPQPSDVEADCLKRAFEQRILFKTISTASTIDDFFLDRGKIEFNWAAQQWIETLEGDRIDVGGMNGCKSR